VILVPEAGVVAFDQVGRITPGLAEEPFL